MKISREQHQRIRELQKVYRAKQKEITCRLSAFAKCLDEKDDTTLFSELAFCLLTPQSKAQCCWDAIRSIQRHDLLLSGTENDIKRKLHRVRFHNKKARYLVEARVLFQDSNRLSIKAPLRKFSDVYECREWLVRNIKGIGHKEASHFLRNIGLGKDIAILDRHILRNLVRLGIIQDVPASLSKKNYLEIEQKMSQFAREIKIPLAHLDLLFWYKETGEIFK